MSRRDSGMAYGSQLWCSCRLQFWALPATSQRRHLLRLNPLRDMASSNDSILADYMGFLDPSSQSRSDASIVLSDDSAIPNRWLPTTGVTLGIHLTLECMGRLTRRLIRSSRVTWEPGTLVSAETESPMVKSRQAQIRSRVEEGSCVLQRLQSTATKPEEAMII